MPKRKSGLSRDHHAELGAELSAMRNRLGEIAVQVGNAYPVAVGDVALRAQAGVDRLRSKLDELVFREHPGSSTKDNASVYYPQRDGR